MTFSASDLDAPCPADAQCIWSGIVVRSGSWRLRGRLIELSVDQDLLEEAIPGEAPRCEYRRDKTSDDSD